MTKNEIEQMVNTISKYEKRLFEMSKQNEKLFYDNSTFVDRLQKQREEIARLKAENEQLKEDIKEVEIELNRRVIR